MDIRNTLMRFEASTVPLLSSNLIEASAGTGKTYSIAILALRLILEKQISIKEILMVTFTKAAVAELEERIRGFIRSADQVAKGKNIDDRTIYLLVKKAIEEFGEEAVRDTLYDAILFLDETSVMTIHSFCQQTLTEFAFETNQLFGLELVNDIAVLVEDEVNQFWRKNITLIRTDLLKLLIEFGLSRAGMVEIVKASLEGKKYIGNLEYEADEFNETEQNLAIEKLQMYGERETQFYERLCERVKENVEDLRDISAGNRYAKKSILPLLDYPDRFIEHIGKSTSAYILELYPEWVDECKKLDGIIAERTQAIQSVLNTVYSFAIKTINKNIAGYKQRNAILSFNDLIANLHTALVQHKNERLVAALQKKYKAVFIDEFQDTDRLQYEIFQRAFSDAAILFYIGDPKQSIYAWRQADINTYFKASHEVNRRYGMNINYRSSVPFIDAMNLFFKPRESFDTFFFNEKEDAIEYIEVDSPSHQTKGNLYQGGECEVPITIFENGNKDEIAQTVCAQIARLLENDIYQLVENGKKRSIRPADIGILVRKNKDGTDLKKLLTRYGIPSITIDDHKILRTKEAQSLIDLLMAFTDNKTSRIHKALLSPFTGYTRNEIEGLDDEVELERFKGYGVLWHKNGIYVTLMQFIEDYSVKNVLLSDKKGERAMTNIVQLIEILHKQQSVKKYSNIELIHWLKRGTEGMQVEGDEFEQRMESDEEAVKIASIHSSKGLEYNIVFAPFLDLKDSSKSQFCSFRDEESGAYLFAERSQLNPEQTLSLKEQIEQENRRLIYVAITRAVYKCYINRNNYIKNSSLQAFVNELKTSDLTTEKIDFEEPIEISAGYRYAQNKIWQNAMVHKANRFELTEKYWRKLSYTYLAKKNNYIPRDHSHIGLKDYEEFVFKSLIRGSITGNMLHYILENVDFTARQHWEKIISSGLKRFMPQYSESYAPMLAMLLQHTLHASVSIEGYEVNLSDIPKEKRLVELEFDFNVPVFNTAILESIPHMNGLLNMNYHGYLEGIMNGKIDLFFEYKGRYYILDWKSNFLGDSLDYYQPENLREAMGDHNYHLQYLIYTVAAKKYLQQRIPGFNYESHFGGVIYVFLRGTRAGRDTGIFTYKPSLLQVSTLEEIFTR